MADAMATRAPLLMWSADRPNGIGGGGFGSHLAGRRLTLRAVLVAVLVVGLERGWLLICGGSVCRGGRGGRPQ